VRCLGLFFSFSGKSPACRILFFLALISGAPASVLCGALTLPLPGPAPDPSGRSCSSPSDPHAVLPSFSLFAEFLPLPWCLFCYRCEEKLPSSRPCVHPFPQPFLSGVGTPCLSGSCSFHLGSSVLKRRRLLDALFSFLPSFGVVCPFLHLSRGDRIN